MRTILLVMLLWFTCAVAAAEPLPFDSKERQEHHGQLMKQELKKKRQKDQEDAMKLKVPLEQTCPEVEDDLWVVEAVYNPSFKPESFIERIDEYAMDSDMMLECLRRGFKP